jgi:hypothetical protein
MKKKSAEKTRKRTSVEALRNEKSTTIITYIDFQELRRGHSSDKDIAESLGTDTATLDLLRKDPKYKSLLDKIQTLTTDGLIVLMQVIGTKIRKSANLTRLREKLDGFKTEMKEILEEWYTAHADLNKAVKGEGKRLILQNTLLKKVEVDSANKLDMGTMGMHKDIVKLIKKTAEFKQTEKKIKTAPLNEIIRFADGSVFVSLNKKIRDITTAEKTRQKLLSRSKDNYAKEEAKKINQNSNKLEQIKRAMKNSSVYKEFIKKLRSANTDKMLAIEKNKAKVLKNYNEKLAIIGYRYINKIKTDEALTPYLKLKPKGFARGKYLKMLKKSPFYKKALVDANSKNFSVQKNFNPARYFDYKSEAGAESKNTLYNYARMVKESLSKNPDVGTAASTNESESSV